jgi:hypothetical protein
MPVFSFPEDKNIFPVNASYFSGSDYSDSSNSSFTRNSPGRSFPPSRPAHVKESRDKNLSPDPSLFMLLHRFNRSGRVIFVRHYMPGKNFSVATKKQ